MKGSPSFLIVGAGYAGAVTAERLATAGFRCTIIDRRSHVAGNAFDEYDAHGVLVHRYGPHIFHTNADRVFEYLSRFTQWRGYEHRVLCSIGSTLYPFPINRRTLEMVYGRSLSESDAAALIEQVREPQELVRNSEQLVLNAVGRKLYEMFFQGYTTKQWGRPPSALAAGVAARIPVRTNDDDRYFTDIHQAMPREGYTRMFENILDHPLIDVRLESDFSEWKVVARKQRIVYTGPIDEFFGQRYGPLPYRSLRFESAHLGDADRYQSVGTVNYPNEHAFTRITEFKHLTGQQCSGTSIVREFPQETGEPYYPIPTEESAQLYKRYAALANETEDVYFVGRLAQYRYYNMDQVVAAALSTADKILGQYESTTGT